MSREQLPALTGLRFLLATWVSLYHQTNEGGLIATVTWPWWIMAPLRTGYAAVSVFFLLSGFILSHSYSLKNTWTNAEAWRFGVARFARIYPVYSLGLLSFLILALLAQMKHLVIMKM